MASATREEAAPSDGTGLPVIPLAEVEVEFRRD